MASPKTIEELFNALKSAPQEKEGAFRVATWRMVLEEFRAMQVALQTLQTAMGIVEKKANEAVAKAPDAEAIKQAVKDDISKADANKVLF